MEDESKPEKIVAVTKEEKKALWRKLCDTLHNTGLTFIENGVVDERNISPFRLAEAVLESIKKASNDASMAEFELEQIVRKARGDAPCKDCGGYHE